MEFVVKKTTELSITEQTEILSLFNTVFEKNRTIEHFQNQFLNNPLGFSYHSMIIEKNKIVGCDSYIPSYYLVNGKRVLFANGVDTMVSKPYRDFVNLYDMVTIVHDYMKNEGVKFVYGFPNDNAYPIFHKAKLMDDIGKLNTYILPCRIGGIKSKLKLFNGLSALFVNVYLYLITLFSSKKVYHFIIEKEASSYNTTRYKRLDRDYKIINYKGNQFVYKLMEYEGIKSAFLVDVLDKSPKNFNKAIKYIFKNEYKKFDVLLYVGFLPFISHGLIRIPRKLEPKNFHFTGKMLRKDEIDKDTFFQIKNWDVNLSNYDLL